MSCCNETGCRRKTPIVLYRGDFSGAVYAVTRATIISQPAKGDMTMSAINRHDVTQAMREFIRRNPEWIREVLAEVPGG